MADMRPDVRDPAGEGLPVHIRLLYPCDPGIPVEGGGPHRTVGGRWAPSPRRPCSRDSGSGTRRRCLRSMTAARLRPGSYRQPRQGDWGRAGQLEVQARGSCPSKANRASSVRASTQRPCILHTGVSDTRFRSFRGQVKILPAIIGRKSFKVSRGPDLLGLATPLRALSPVDCT